MPALRSITPILIASSLMALATGDCLAQSPQATPAAGKTPPKPIKPYVFNMPGLHYADDIPVNFPVPAYTSHVTKKNFLNTTKGTPSAKATIFTTDQVEAVYGWYKDSCKRDGWTYKTPSAEASKKLSKSGPLYMIDAKKDKNQIFIFCHTDKKSGGTKINISWCRDKK